MKKLLSVAFAAICLMASTISCTKDVVVASYGFDQSELEALQYVTGHEADVTAFFNDLGGIITKFGGTEFTESEIVAAVDAVVARYDNKYIQGTFSLYEYDVDTHAKIDKVKTWTLHVAE